jgi:phosphotransferase system IIB component
MKRNILLAIILFLFGYALSFASYKHDSSIYLIKSDYSGCNNYNISTVSAREVWNNYINALGGAKNLKKVNDRATIMESKINGQKVVMTVYQKAPDKIKQIIATPSLTQDVLFDGNKGIMKVGEKKMDITGKELEKLKYESMVNFVLNIDSLGIKINSGGMEKVNGSDSYKIEILYPSGSKIIQYFDAKTWLKVKQVEDVIAAKKTYVQETYFSDYREVKGVKYPFLVKESLGAESFEVVVTLIKVNTGLDGSLFVIK